MGFPDGSDGKESAHSAGDPGLIPGSGRSLQKGMATYSSILVWRIPWTEKPGKIQSMWLRRVRNDWGTNTILTSNTIQLGLGSQPPHGLNGFPCGSIGKESACSAGYLGSTPGLGRSPGEGKGYPLQYSGLEISTDWIVHGVTKSRTQPGNLHFHRTDI